jgi:hypothetical protein
VSFVEKYSEEEAINVTIANGYDGEEFDTEAWKTRGCLKSNGTYKKFISKLETIFNHVEVTGKGKKRIYILKDKRNEVTERKLNYKGKVPTEQDEIMKEYIFNQLIQKRNGSDYTYSLWAKELGFINTDLLDVKEMIKSIKDLHYGSIKYNSKDIVSKFISELSNRNKNVIEKSFQRLVNEGRVVLSETYYFKTIEDELVEVDEEQYIDARQVVTEYLKGEKITYYAYSQSVNSFYKTDKMKQVIKEVDELLNKLLEIKYFFKSYRVVVINPDVKYEVSKDEFHRAYFQRLVKLIQQRQGKDTYMSSISFWKRFLLLNTLYLIDYIGIKDHELLLKKQMKRRSDDMEVYSIDLTIYEFEKQEQKRKQNSAFGGY